MAEAGSSDESDGERAAPPPAQQQQQQQEQHVQQQQQAQQLQGLGEAGAGAPAGPFGAAPVPPGPAEQQAGAAPARHDAAQEARFTALVERCVQQLNDDFLSREEMLVIKADLAQSAAYFASRCAPAAAAAAVLTGCLVRRQPVRCVAATCCRSSTRLGQRRGLVLLFIISLRSLRPSPPPPSSMFRCSREELSAAYTSTVNLHGELVLLCHWSMCAYTGIVKVRRRWELWGVFELVTRTSHASGAKRCSGCCQMQCFEGSLRVLLGPHVRLHRALSR